MTKRERGSKTAGAPESGAKSERFPRDLQFYKFSTYGFLKNLRFFDPFLVLFFLEKGLSYVEIGTLYAAREIAVNVLEIPTGALADAIGRRRTMIASFVSYIASFIIFYLGSSIGAFFIAMGLFSFGEAFRTGTHKAMIFTWLRQTGNERFRTDYYGHTRGWSQTGSAISSIIAAAIVFGSGRYSTVFLFSIIPYLLDLLLMLTYPASLDGLKRSGGRHELFRGFRDLAGSLKTSFSARGAVKTVMSAAAWGGFFKGSKDYLQPMVAALALSLPVATGLPDAKREALVVGLVFTILYFFSAYASRHTASVASRFASARSAMNWELAVGLALGILIGGFAWMGLRNVAVFLFIIVYMIQNLRTPLSVSVVSETVEERVLATVLSVDSQLQSFVAAGVAFAIGLIAQLVDGRVGAGILAVSLVGFAALPLLWLPRLSTDPPTPADQVLPGESADHVPAK